MPGKIRGTRSSYHTVRLPEELTRPKGLDAGRVDTVQRLVPHPEKWPLGKLPMKRIEGDRIVEFGMIHREDCRPPSITIRYGSKKTSFPDIEALIVAGWAVD